MGREYARCTSGSCVIPAAATKAFLTRGRNLKTDPYQDKDMYYTCDSGAVPNDCKNIVNATTGATTTCACQVVLVRGTRAKAGDPWDFGDETAYNCQPNTDPPTGNTTNNNNLTKDVTKNLPNDRVTNMYKVTCSCLLIPPQYAVGLLVPPENYAVVISDLKRRYGEASVLEGKAHRMLFSQPRPIELV